MSPEALLPEDAGNRTYVHTLDAVLRSCVSEHCAGSSHSLCHLGKLQYQLYGEATGLALCCGAALRQTPAQLPGLCSGDLSVLLVPVILGQVALLADKAFRG